MLVANQISTLKKERVNQGERKEAIKLSDIKKKLGFTNNYIAFIHSKFGVIGLQSIYPCKKLCSE